MFLKSSWLPARIPFTLLMLPLFWLVLSISPNLNEWRSLWILAIIHVLLYGSVNAYAHFFDSQSKKVNGFTVTYNTSSDALLNIAIIIHTLAFILGFVYVNLSFSILILAYGLIAYAGGVTGVLSKPAVLTWLIIRITQGFVATIIYYIGLNDFPIENALQFKVLLPAVISSLILAAFFPIKQTTPKRTLYQSTILLLIAAGLSVWFFTSYVSPAYNTGVLIAFGFALIILFQQYYSIPQSEHTSSRYSAWIHWISTAALNGYSFYVFTDYTQIFQLVY